MRPLLIIMLLFLSTTLFGQEVRFMIQGKIVNQKDEPISDVYIVNLVTNEKDISSSDGIFTIHVLPTDSIILSHISYFRKIERIHDILLDPIVKLYSENVDIPEVKVTPEQQSDIERANNNLQFLDEYKPPTKLRMQEEELDPVTSIMTEHNDQMRVEASSISLVRFSPSENVGKLFTKLQRKDRSNDYSSTRKQLEEVEKKKELQ